MAQLQELQKQQDALTAHFVKDDRYKNEPWRREMDKAMEEYNVSEKTTTETQQKNFIEYAKQHMLHPDDVLVGFYTLFAKPEALRAFTENLLRKNKERAYNGSQFSCFISHERSRPGEAVWADCGVVAGSFVSAAR